MPRRLLQAAPTRLTTYCDCPRRYRFSYLDRPAPAKGPPWAHNSFGASVHTALAEWWRLPLPERRPDAAGALLDRAWLPAGFRDDAQRAAAQQRARAMVVRYAGRLDPSNEPVGVERTVAIKTEHAALFGRVDRIDDRRGVGLVVVDYKTGRAPLTDDDARTSLALAVYAAATQRTLHQPCRRVELHHLPSGEVLTWEHSDEALQRHLRRADSLALEIAELDERFRAGVSDAVADELYPARVGPLCGWCDYHRVCPAGSATIARDPWAGIDD